MSPVSLTFSSNTCEPMLLCHNNDSVLKSTLRPLESVKRPSSNI